MTSALQRVVPQARDEAEAVAALRWALILGLTPCLILAAVASLGADWLAGVINVAVEDRAQLATGIRLFAWALPLWALVEIGTSAARARRSFGPEIRLRIVWEQLLRLAAAVALWAAGVDTLGLLIAHLLSLAITAALTVRLVARHYDLRLWRRARGRSLLADTASAGIAVLPANIMLRLFSDAPPVVLNLWFPGAAGAAAAGLWAVARKLSSLVQMVRLAFAHVMGPLASAAARHDNAAILPLYAFSTRISVAVALPVAASLIGGRHTLLRLFGPEAYAAGAILTMLTLGRAVEALGGQAAAIQQVVSPKLRPMLTSAFGLATAAALATVLLPPFGVGGLAAAVAFGIAAMAAAVLLLLWRDTGLHPFAPPFARTAITAAAVGLALIIAASPLARLPSPLALPLLAALMLTGVWTSARMGLPPSDKAALGGLARKLRLIDRRPTRA